MPCINGGHSVKCDTIYRILYSYPENERRKKMERNNRILIVDDQRDLCEQLAKLLLKTGKSNDTVSLVQQMRARLMGNRDTLSEEQKEKEKENSLYEVEFVNQGMDAAAKIEESIKNNNPYALVFLDMRMPPGWDGLETAKKIRELDKDVEIVIMTAYADHDQKQIAEQVGHPEKLLYIKKPFQAEEIYQLALSLTAKWNLEWTEKRRKKWLEAIIRGLCKLKSPNVSKTITGAFIPALKSFLDLMDSGKGLAASFSSDKWQLHCFNGMSEEEANAFLIENSAFLKDCRTTKHKEDKYFLPLRKDNFSAIIVVFDVQTKNDPEWYKLLSILSMTVSDIIGECVELGVHTKPAKIAALPKLLAKLCVSSEGHIGTIKSNLGMIKEQGAEQLVLDLISKSINSADEINLDIRNALFCAGEIKANPLNTELLPLLRESVEIGSFGKAAFKFEGDENIKVYTDPALLKDAFANLARNSSARSREAVWIELKAKQHGNSVIITYSDNTPGIPQEHREKAFSLLNGNNLSDTSLPVVSMILSDLEGKIQLEQSSNDSGAKFTIELPSAKQS